MVWRQFCSGISCAAPFVSMHACMPLIFCARAHVQVCNHPYLFNIDAEPHFDGVTTGEDIVEASGKMQVCVCCMGVLIAITCSPACMVVCVSVIDAAYVCSGLKRPEMARLRCRQPRALHWFAPVCSAPAAVCGIIQIKPASTTSDSPVSFCPGSACGAHCSRVSAAAWCALALLSSDESAQQALNLDHPDHPGLGPQEMLKNCQTFGLAFA